ncbi:MAG: DMT family transporter [Burkholderiaceae bacterium]
MQQRTKAILALLGVGATIGLTTNLAKLAGQMQIPALGFLFWSLVVADALLLMRAAVWRELPPVGRRPLEYYVVAGLLTAAGANIIFFLAIPKTGAAYISLVLALPPLLTYVGALFFRLERFDALRFVGVITALAGVAWLAMGELRAQSGNTVWLLLGLTGPLILAAGDIYRTLRWPAGASPLALTPGMLGCALVVIALTSVGLGHPIAIGLDRSTIALVASEGLAFALQYLLLFMLQKLGGPVLLSLIGGVGALVAVPVAFWVLGEALPANLALAATGICVGLVLVAGRASRGEPAAVR